MSGALPKLMPGAALLEVVGRALLVPGRIARPAAFPLSGMIAVACLMLHAPMNFHPVPNGGDRAIPSWFVFVLLVSSGPGAFRPDSRPAACPWPRPPGRSLPSTPSSGCAQCQPRCRGCRRPVPNS